MMSMLGDLINQKGFLLADGATGTNYFTLGLETGYAPELWNEEKPDLVKGLHQRFLVAGADILLTNSFGGNSYRLKLHEAEGRVTELNSSAAKLAKEAVTESGNQALIGGSMGPTGELFAPLGTLSHEEAVEAFKAQAEALAEGGVDMLWIETIFSFEEVNAAMIAASSTGLPVVATMTFDTAGKSMMGVSPEEYASYVSDKGAAALGANCGIGPAELMHSIMLLKDHATCPIVAKGNCGIPEYIDGEMHYHGSPELMARYAVLARDAGVEIIGGCCGTTPEHLAAMRKALDTTPKSEGIDMARIEAELGKPWQTAETAADAPNNKERRRSRKRR